MTPRPVDLAVAMAVLAAVSLPFVFPINSEAPSPGLVGYLLAAGTALPLIWRRPAPLLCAVLVAGFTVGSVLYDRPGQPFQYGAAVAVFTVAELGTRRQRNGLIAAWVCGVVVVSVVGGDRDPVGIAFAALTVISAHLLGRLVAATRERAELAELDVHRRNRLGELEADRVRQQERQGIARDVHDIVAHAVSVMIVQAEAGAAAVTAGSQPSTRQFDEIAESGRGALGQLRRTLSVLREPPDPAHPSGNEELMQIVERIRLTGLRVELHTDGEPPTSSPIVDTAVHRIVGEALTNVVRHAAATRAVVEWEYGPDDLVLIITDDGTNRSTGEGPDSGHGLQGIRERAALCGGTAEAGPLPERGFRVRVTLPYRRTGDQR